jgi:N utilization substance protein A
LDERERVCEEKRVELGVSDELAALTDLTGAMLVMLGEKDVRTLDDLGDLASDELIEIVGASNMDETKANALIMAARAHWFDDEDGAAPTEEASPTEESSSVEEPVVDANEGDDT